MWEISSISFEKYPSTTFVHGHFVLCSVMIGENLDWFPGLSFSQAKPGQVAVYCIVRSSTYVGSGWKKHMIWQIYPDHLDHVICYFFKLCQFIIFNPVSHVFDGCREHCISQ